MAVSENQKHSVDAALDIDSVNSDDWGRRSFPIQGQGSRNLVQVVVKRSVLNAICEHGLSRTDVEVCGVLVGNCYQDERGPFIYIEAMIQGEHSDNKVAQVTFTSETWNHIQNVMEEHFGGQRILGWYHTHPGFGIFLSAMDMFIHENFFNDCEQLAFVYDPLNREDGLFVWRKGKIQLHQYLVEEDSATSQGLDSKKESTMKPRLTAAAHALGDDVLQRLHRLEQRNRLLEWCNIATAVFAVVWPFLFAWFDLSTFIRPDLSKAEFPESVPVTSPSSPNGRRRDAAIPELPKGRPLRAEPRETPPAAIPVEPQPNLDTGSKRTDEVISSPEHKEANSESGVEIEGNPGNKGAERRTFSIEHLH